MRNSVCPVRSPSPGRAGHDLADVTITDPDTELSQASDEMLALVVTDTVIDPLLLSSGEDRAWCSCPRTWYGGRTYYALACRVYGGPRPQSLVDLPGQYSNLDRTTRTPWTGDRSLGAAGSS
jgi:hypothetical protein